MSVIAPPKPPPPKPPAAKTAPAAAPVQVRKFSVSKGKVDGPLVVILYGCGGIGKSELAANLAQIGLKVLFIDLENGSKQLDIERISDINSFEEARSVLQDQELIGQYDAVVLDSLTKVEELAIAWVIANVPHEKGAPIRGIEDYGWGKGYAHVYEAMLRLLGDLDALVRRGKHVVCIAHECVNKPENPEGDNTSKYEPRLFTTKDGKNSVRYRFKEWADHLLFVKYDQVVVDGKARGCGTRAIYCQEMPQYWAKSRLLSEPIVYEKGSALLWQQLLNKE
jgi:hypothetical protein